MAGAGDGADAGGGIDLTQDELIKFLGVTDLSGLVTGPGGLWRQFNQAAPTR